MKKFILIAVIFLLLCSGHLKAGEIIFGWNIKNPSGTVWDMKFMPDESKFIVLAGITESGQIQIRESETGSLIQTYPNNFASFANFEFTKDSTRILIANSNFSDLSMFNLNDMSLIKELKLNNDTIAKWFTHLAVDPIRPYVYVTTYSEKGPLPPIIRGQVSVYNYETMELVTHLTGYDENVYDCLAISKDGKYLAAINNGKSFLKVWSLDSMSLIRNFQLYDNQLPKRNCEVKDIKFMNNDSDNLFISGFFPKNYTNYFEGIFLYNLTKNNLIDSTFRDISSGNFIFFNNDNKILLTNSFALYVLNIVNKSKEFYSIIWQIDSLSLGSNLIYSNLYNLFIGNFGAKISMIKYDSNVGVTTSNSDTSTLFPNPTNSLINIKLNCEEGEQNYEIYNSIGIMITQKTQITNASNLFSIDFSKYPNGIYFLNVYCGEKLSTYKIIKNG